MMVVVEGKDCPTASDALSGIAVVLESKWIRCYNKCKHVWILML